MGNVVGMGNAVQSAAYSSQPHASVAAAVDVAYLIVSQRAVFRVIVMIGLRIFLQPVGVKGHQSVGTPSQYHALARLV